LAAAPLLALSGCGEGYDVARHQAAAPAPAEGTCRFEQSRQILPVSRASWLAGLDDITPRHWPAGMYDDFRKHQELKRARGSRAPDWPTRRADRYRFESFRSPARSYVVRPGGHTLFFVSLLTMRNTMRSGGGGSGSFHTIVVLDVDGSMQERVLVKNVEGGHADAPLEYQVAAVDDGVLVVYATIDSIFQIVGRPAADGLAYSKPQLVYRLQAPALDLGLATSPDRLHLVWTQPGEDPEHRALHYVSSTGPGADWSAPTAIAQSAQPFTTNLLTQDQTIFVAWTDGRFDTRAAPASRPGRVMVAASRDEGATFSRPVVISDLTDADDTAAQLLVTLSGRDLVVYWSSQPPPAWPQLWSRAVLDPDLEVVTPAGELAGDDLLAAYSERMASVLDDRSSRTRSASAD
jgi:hypothetical protein